MHIWPTTLSQAFFDYERNVKYIDRHVQKEIFPKLKFISSPEMMDFSTDPQSICQVICDMFKVESNGQRHFWSIYKNCISTRLNKKGTRLPIS